MPPADRFKLFAPDVETVARLEAALIESERRFRAIFNQTTHFVGLLEPDGTVLEVNQAALDFRSLHLSDVVGRPFWETPWWDISPDVRDRLRDAVAEAASDLVQYEVDLLGPDGTARTFDFSLKPVTDETGQVLLLVPEGYDITERKRAEDEVRLLQTVTLAIGEAEELHEALRLALHRVCEVTGWAVGQAWLPRPDESALDCSPAWCACAEGLERFRTASEAIAPQPGEGLVGRAWSDKQPIWVRDVAAEGGFLRAPEACAAGLKAGLAVPVLAGTRAVAVLEFFMVEAREQEERLVGLVSAVAAQLGSVIERKRAEAERARLLLQSEAAEARFRGLVESAPDAIVMIRGDGRIALVNRQTEAMFGYARDELLGQPVEILMPERFRTVHVGHRLDYAAAPRTRPMGAGLELYGRRKDGSEFPVQISLSPMEAERELLVTSVIRDITTQRSLEREKDEFLGNVSHDLRTPLAAIKASIGVVLANEPPATPEPLHRMFVNIDLAADRMAKLVADLLELTRLQAGRAQLRTDRCDLRTVALRSVRAIEPLAQSRAQHVKVDLPAGQVTAVVDAERLEQALLNLLSNAHKYGRTGGNIRLRLVQRAGRATFGVTDDGPGIPEADRKRIFDRFYRPETEATRRSQGSGLGLPIARAMVELHGGRIWVESEPGAGCTFWIELPTNVPDPGEG